MRIVIIKIMMMASLVTGIVILGKGQNLQPDKIVAKVEEYIVLESDVKHEYLIAKSRGRQITKCETLKELIIEKMLLVQARRDSVTVSDAAMWNYLDKRIWPCGVGIKDYSDYREQVKKKVYAVFKEQLTRYKMRELIENKVKITPREVKDYFEAFPKDSLPHINDQVEVGHIVRIPALSRREKQKIRQKIEKLRQQVLDPTFRTSKFTSR